MINVKVSIIMPMYNVEDYISESIESVLNQTMTEFELIIIDDSSSDRSFMNAVSYAEKDPRIILKRNLAGKGASAARNYGLDISNGEYIFFLDSDDVLVHDTLEILVRVAVNEQADMVIGHHAMFNEKSENIAWVLEKFPKLKLSGEKNISQNPELLQLPYCWGKLYKKTILQDVKFPYEIIFGEDQVFTIKAYFNARKIYLVDEIIYRYRKREGQATQTAYVYPEKYVVDIINVFKLVEDIINNSDYRNKRARDDLYCYYLNSYLFRNLFSFIANGLLSDKPSTQLLVLEEYKKWVFTLDHIIFLQIKEGLENVNYRISRMMSLFEKNVQDSCEQLFLYFEKKIIKGPPKVTIQTVAYNVEHYIRECAESVLNQSFGEFEWVVLDNGSTDKTREILEEYAAKDKRIKFFKSDRNNIINNEILNPEFVDYIYNIQSQYWCTLDSDDILHQGFLRDLYTAAMNNNNADIAVGGTQKFYQGNSHPNEYRLCPEFYTNDMREAGLIFPSIYFMFSVYWGKLIKTSLLIEVFRYKEKHGLNLKHTDDTLFGLVLLQFARSVVGVKKPLHYYRIRTDSYYNSFIDPNRFKDYIFIYKKNRELLMNWNQFDDINSNFIAEKLFFSILNCIEITAKSTKLSIEEKLQGIETIIDDKFVYEVLRERGMLENLFVETQKLVKSFIKKVPDNSLASVFDHYIFRLFESIEVVNTAGTNKINVLLMYLSSIYDKDNNNKFGAALIYPFLSLLNLRVFSKIKELRITSDLLASDVILIRELVNSRFEFVIDLCEMSSGDTQYDLLRELLLQEKVEVDFLKLERNKQLMVNHFNNERFDEGIELLLNILENCPLDREALIYKFRLLVNNNDLITAVETIEVLKVFYPNDQEILDMYNHFRRIGLGVILNNEKLE